MSLLGTSGLYQLQQGIPRHIQVTEVHLKILCVYPNCLFDIVYYAFLHSYIQGPE